MCPISQALFLDFELIHFIFAYYSSQNLVSMWRDISISFPGFVKLRIRFNSTQSLRASLHLIRAVCVPNTRGLSGACMLCINARLQKTTLNGVQKKSERFLFFKFLDFLVKNYINILVMINYETYLGSMFPVSKFLGSMYQGLMYLGSMFLVLMYLGLRYLVSMFLVWMYLESMFLGLMYLGLMFQVLMYRGLMFLGYQTIRVIEHSITIMMKIVL